MKQRLDQLLVTNKLVTSRSQAESYIKLGSVQVNGQVVTKAGALVSRDDKLNVVTEQYVSRAGLKLASVAEIFKLDFRGKTMLDVGSSTGGFTDYALKHGAKRVVAVELGTDQLHPSLHGDPRIELNEKTDIRDYVKSAEKPSFGIIVMDVSFIALREILPSIERVCEAKTQVVAMCKPQFEAIQSNLKHKGVIKNDRMRRDILKDFENWLRASWVILDKADSAVAGSKGNLERFYLLKKS